MEPCLYKNTFNTTMFGLGNFLLGNHKFLQYLCKVLLNLSVEIPEKTSKQNWQLIEKKYHIFFDLLVVVWNGFYGIYSITNHYLSTLQIRKSQLDFTPCKLKGLVLTIMLFACPLSCFGLQHSEVSAVLR